MAVKYIINKTKMAYEFTNGKVLSGKGVLAADEKLLAELDKDFFFKGLKDREAVYVTQNKPASLEDAGVQLAEKNARIDELRQEVETLRAKVSEKSAMGAETATVIDSDVSRETARSHKKGK